MADPRILTFNIPTKTSPATLKFQVAYSADRITWKKVLVGNTSDLDVSLLASRRYVMDGVNNAVSATDTRATATTPPMFYKIRLKSAGGYDDWRDSFCYPSPEDFVAGMKRALKDPSLNGDPPLLDMEDYLQRVADATAAFETKHHYLAKQTFTLSQNVQTYQLPDDWSPEFSRVLRVNYPVQANDPQVFVPTDRIDIDELSNTWSFVHIFPSASETVTIHFSRRHARNGCTVPIAFYDSVLMWACGSAASQIRTLKNQFGDVFSGAMYAQVDPRIKEWARIAETYQSEAQEIWGNGHSGVRTHVPAYDDHGQIPPTVWGSVRF